MRGHAVEGRGFIKRVLELDGGSDAARTSALIGAGGMDYAAADFQSARQHYEQALQLLQTNDRERANVLDRAGMAARQLMELDDAERLHREALQIHKSQATQIQRGRENDVELALCLNNLGVVAFFRGDLEAARTFHRESLGLREKAGDIRGQASSLNNLGQVARFAGDLEEALDLMERGFALREQINDRWGMAGSEVNLSIVNSYLGSLDLAIEYLVDAVQGFKAVDDPLGLCECLEASAELYCVFKLQEQAVEWFSAAAKKRSLVPAPRPPVHDDAIAKLLADLKADLGEPAYHSSWQQGQEMGASISFEQFPGLTS